MSGLWARWLALLDRKEDGLTLAIFRVAVGLVVLYTFGSVVWHGMVPVLWMDAADGGYLHLSVGWWLVRALGGPTQTVVWGLVGVGMAGGLALTLGLGGRLTPLITSQMLMAVTWINSQAGGSYDDLIANALWLLVLSEATRTHALDCRLRTGRWTDPTPVSAWPRYLIVFQIVVVYFSTALQKVSAYWTPGGDYSALYFILQQPTWQRFDMRWVAHVYPLTQLGTAITWFWEITAPILLYVYWCRDTRTRGGRLRAWLLRHDARLLFAALGVALHLGIFALMEVGPFTWITLSYYLALVHPDEWRALIRGARRRAPAGPSPSESTAHPAA